MSGMDSLHREFAEEMGELAQEIADLYGAWQREPDDREALRQLLRNLHTIKGSAGLLELVDLSDLCHTLEELLQAYRDELAPNLTPEGALDDSIRQGIHKVQSWLQSMKTPGEPQPDLQPLLQELRRQADPDAPEVSRLFTRRVETAVGIETVDSLSISLDAASPLPAPEVPADQDMVNTLLDLLTREDHQDLRRLARPSGMPTHNPLGFSTPSSSRRGDGRRKTSTDESESSVRAIPKTQTRPPAIVEVAPRPQAQPLRRAQLRAPPALVDDRPRDARPTFSELPPQLRGDPVAEALSIPPAPTLPAAGLTPQDNPDWSRVSVESWPSADNDLPRLGERVSNSLRVEVSRIDALLDLLGELLQEKHRSAALVEALEASGPEDLARMAAEGYRRLSLRLDELRDAIVRTRMTPIHSVFRRYPRLVEDMARTLGREVELSIQGEDAELDRALMETLYDPLVHLLRNAVDHGVEPPTERLRRGKSRRGKLTLSASREGSMMVIELRDDGRGIDPARIAARAIAQGLISEEAADVLTAQEQLELIFLPGMTSATEITETSGRGMGMDAVRASLKRIGGRSELHSDVGKGTTMRLLVPLTLAIIQVLLVKVGELRFGLPVSAILDVSRGRTEDLHRTDSGWLLRHPSGLIRVWSLATLIGVCQTEPQPGRFHVAVLGSAERRFAVWADRFEGLFECVIKPLSVKASTIPGVLGGTSIGTGDTTLILDPAALASAALEP